MAKKRKRAPTKKSAFDDFARRKPKLTVLTDHPLATDDAETTFEADPFDFRYKLGPVYDIVRYKDPREEKDRDRRTPLAVLISGGWGTGKTSAMRWLEALLKNWNATGGKPRVHPVWFYPWKYDSKEDVWRGLVSEVIIESIKVENITWQRAKNAAKQFGLFLGKGFLHALASTKFKGKVSAGVVEGGAEADLTCLKDILAEYKDAAHPEKAYLNEFEDSLEKWVTTTLGDDERMIIFIDDLDRCMPDIALQVLEALKLYLNIPKLIFVVGVDKNVVERLVVEHYRKLGLVRDPKDNDTDDERKQIRGDEEKARQYLSKMFQVEVELSPSQEQVREFLGEQLSDIPYWKEQLSEDHRNLFGEIVLKLAGRNPREVKRLLNSGLMAGAGTDMMKPAKGKTQLKFEQGLQYFFVRLILQKRYPSLAGMIDTDIGREFFTDWSRLILQDEENDVSAFDAAKAMRPGEKGTTPRDRVGTKLGDNAQYEDLLRLLSDDDLWLLLQIPFSPELAELTQQVAPGSGTGSSGRPSTFYEEMTAYEKLTPSKDETIVREAVARALEKSPSELTSADYETVTNLTLYRSPIEDLARLKKLKNLEKLILSECKKIDDLEPLKALTKLWMLHLDGTQVVDIEPLKVLTNLQRLQLDNTPVADIEPLKALNGLNWLSLTNTQVANIEALRELTNLQAIYLDKTHVTDIKPLKELANLQRLYLTNTPVTSAQLKELREARPNLGINR